MCWALNEYQKINKEFWKRLVCENPEAIWLIIDGSQRGTDIIHNVFQEFEINEHNKISLRQKNEKGNMILGKLDDLSETENKLDEISSKAQLFHIYYERFASPRKLIAIPRIKTN